MRTKFSDLFRADASSGVKTLLVGFFAAGGVILLVRYLVS
jgi:hypothetical protein